MLFVRSRIRRLGLAVFLLLGSLHCTGHPAVPRTVVLISVDTLRADHVGLYGSGRATTPNIDRFFGPGTVFENAISPAPCTVPAVLQFLWSAYLVQSAPSPLAKILADAGYSTAAMVSQHNFIGQRLPLYRWGFHRFDIQLANEVDHHGLTRRRAQEVSDRAIAWLHKTAADERRFLWLHYFDPHDPYDPPPGFRGFDAGNRSLRTGDRRSALKKERRSQREDWNQAGYIFSPEDVAHLVNLYDGEIQYTDFQIGRVLDVLEEQGRLDRSIVVLISDHGEWLGEGDRWDHCATLREEEIRVPFAILVDGGRIGRGAREVAPVSTLDVLPTVLGLLGVDYPAALYDGKDLRRNPRDRSVFAMWRTEQVVRRGDWKLFYDKEPVALYRISEDRHERTNLLADRPAIRDELAAEVRARSDLTARVGELHEDTVDRLKQLGYIE